MTKASSLAPEAPTNYPRFADAFVVSSAMVVSAAIGSWLSLRLNLALWAATCSALGAGATLMSLHGLVRRSIITAGGAIDGRVFPWAQSQRLPLPIGSATSAADQFSAARLQWPWARWHLALACATCAAASAYYVYNVEDLVASDQLAGLTIFLCAAVSSIVGFAFSALAGSLLFHFVPDTVQAVRIMLVASISIQAYSVWKLRENISICLLAPYIAGGLLTVGPGVYLLLTTPTRMYFLALGVFLVAYGAYTFRQQPIQVKTNSLFARVAVGALGGITGATAAFPGAFITIWCGLHGWDKQRQRAIYQPYILGMQLFTLVALGAATSAETMRFELLQYIIPAVGGAYVGLRVFESLSTSQFNKLVSVFLALSGVLLSLKAL